MVLFISINTLKTEYIIDDNLDDKYILSIIKKGQDFNIKPILGNIKYQQLLNDINDNSVSTEDDILIKDYIQPVLAYFVLSELVYATAYKMKNAPDYQSNPNTDRFEELIRISKHYLNDSKAYENILIQYIINNNIVLQSNDGNGVLKSEYKSGIFLG